MSLFDEENKEKRAFQSIKYTFNQNESSKNSQSTS